MWAFLSGVALLAAGYAGYGRWVEKAVRPHEAQRTPAFACGDGVDYVPMPAWRVYLIQLLNIAGLGPVFGPILGALWGPQVFLWIVFGAILGGAVHDFLSGVMSMRNGGAGLPELIGRYLGRPARHVATAFILLLMVLVGTVFVKGPAMLIAELLPADTFAPYLGPQAAAWLSSSWGGQAIWLWLIMLAIFAYYLLATLLPIDRIIGRVYPFFAIALLVMVLGLSVAILGDHQIAMPRFTLENLHPKSLAAWPIIFITVSCGAVSGFHATQSPMMARCLKSERHMRLVFYGAMIAEGFIALVWASVAQGFYEGPAALQAVLASGGPGRVVHEACVATMGLVGGGLAFVGVIVLPITSGDTAFRVARLIVADATGITQEQAKNRYKVALPLFAVAVALTFVNFSVIWRYFGWANQTLAAVALWTATVFLAKRGSRWLIAAIPATFMTIVTTSYICVEEHGLGLPASVGTAIGIILGVVALGVFLLARKRLGPEEEAPSRSEPIAVERKGDSIAL